VKRRTFIAGLGSAVAWPVVVRAQQGDRVRRIGVLMLGDENDPEGKLRYSAFLQGLADLGWTDGRNVQIDLRWGGVHAFLARNLNPRKSNDWFEKSPWNEAPRKGR
jgi:putative ABC transport system substrate-binding protein